MQLQVVTLDVLEYVLDLDKWNIIATTSTDQVIDVDSAFNQDEGEVFDEDDLRDQLVELNLISENVEFWRQLNEECLIDYVLVCKPSLEPVLKLTRVEGS